MKCPQCDKDILGDLKWDNWIKMIHFIEFLSLQGSITPQLAEEMSDCMMAFKTYAEDETEKQIKKRNRKDE